MNTPMQDRMQRVRECRKPREKSGGSMADINAACDAALAKRGEKIHKPWYALRDCEIAHARWKQRHGGAS